MILEGLRNFGMSLNTPLGTPLPRKHLYFDVMMGLVSSCELESYAGGSLLLVGSPMPEGSKVMSQTKRDVLVLQVAGWAWG